ncbi:MAG: DUF5671 domain-containing protein [Gemmatimonadales bacterium]
MAIPDELVAFVKEALTRELPRPAIQQALLAAGWERKQVDAGLASFAESDFAIPVPRPAPYLSAREAFIYLLLFTTLYLSAYNLGALLFQFIYLAIPDAAAPAYASAPEAIRVSMRWAIASLVVAFPIFLYLSRLTGTEVHRDPAKRASKVRRWLTYLTLFLAATIIIGDLITILNDLLGGALTLRFVLKALTVGVIAAGIFGYYLHDLRVEERGVTR